MAKQTTKLRESFAEYIDEVQPHLDSERLMVIAASTYVEIMVAALIEHHCKHGKKINEDSRVYPLATKLMLLNELGIIGDAEYRTLDRLRRIRNNAAHEVSFTVDKADVKYFATGLKKSPDEVTVSDAMLAVIIHFWANHVETLGTLLPKYK